MGETSLPGDASVTSGHRDDELEWILTRATLEANDRTSRVLEQYLLHAARGQEADYESMASNLEQAIQEHQRAIEELELAIEAIEGVSDGDTP